MHPRVLSPLEERQIRSYLKRDGEKNLNVRVLVSRSKKYLPKIKEDLELLEMLLEAYEQQKTK